MTTTDSTRQKLVNSMRKTKAKSASTAKSQPASKSADAGRTATKSRKAAAPKAPQAQVQAAQIPVDPYQGAPRVWPD